MALDYKGAMRLKMDSKEVMHEIEATFQMQSDFSEVASKDITGKDYIPKDVTWSIAVSAVADNSASDAQQDLKAIADSAVAQSDIVCLMTDAISGNMTITGTAIIENFNVKFVNKEVAAFDYTLKGKGVPVFGTTT